MLLDELDCNSPRAPTGLAVKYHALFTSQGAPRQVLPDGELSCLCYGVGGGSKPQLSSKRMNSNVTVWADSLKSLILTIAKSSMRYIHS